MTLNIKLLSDKFGIASTGVDVSQEVDEPLFHEILDLFVKKQVLVFRNQHIEPSRVRSLLFLASDNSIAAALARGLMRAGPSRLGCVE